MNTQNSDALIDEIIDTLSKLGVATLEDGYKWVSKRLHRFKDVYEACEYSVESCN